MAPNNENLTVTLYKVNDLRVELKPIPEPKDDEVLLKMDSVGICGSDVHYWMKGAIGDFVVKAPMIIGHEGAGVVQRCGKNVKTLKPGDRVAIEPGYPCRMCDYCKTGRYNLCPDMTFAATPPVDGNLRQYYCHPADFCFKIPDTMTMEEAALMEPTAVAVHSCRRAGVELGKTVLVCGAGPIGLVNVVVAQAMGATEVVVTDIDEGRLKVAKSLGATATYLVKRGKTPQECAEEIVSNFTENFKPNITIECSGAQPSICTGIYATRPGGVMVCVGLGAEHITMPIVHAAVHEIDLRGIFRYSNCYPAAIGMVASGKVDLKPLVTHRYDLKDAIKAFETARDGTGGAIKVMLKC